MIALISAVDGEWGIGKGGLIPWHYSEDFQYFKDKTKKATCMMGRTTYEEIAGMRKDKDSVLPGRECVVFSRSALNDDRVKWCNDIANWRHVATRENIFFIGGTSIFRYGLEIADKAFITRIPGIHGCDVFFPYEDLQDKYAKTGTFQISEELFVEEYTRML